MEEVDPRHTKFLRLYTAHEPAIRAFVRRLVPTRQDATDVMQEIALVLWRKYDDAVDDGGFRPWAFWVARYEALAWRRDKARDRHVLDENLMMMLADESAAAEERLAAHREALEGCLGKLQPPQRQLLLAAYCTRGNMQGLARKSGRSSAGFYQWLYRVRQQLLDCVRLTVAKDGLS